MYVGITIKYGLHDPNHFVRKTIKYLRKHKVKVDLCPKTCRLIPGHKPGLDFHNNYDVLLVFEGDGDARLFEKFYGLLDKGDWRFDRDMTSFYQGGKCSDIKKYFETKPIQLGSAWVFLLDSDEPANELKDFLERNENIDITGVCAFPSC